MLVDGAWTFLGSANWDARSLRLNFEFNVECYGRDLAARLNKLVQEKLAVAEPVTRELIASWSLPRRLRNAAEEMSHAAEFKYAIINNNFDDARLDLRAIVRAERVATGRQLERHPEVFRTER